MNAKPVLALQMRRIGDLILTQPLLEDLKRCYPNSPVWVAAQPCFSEQLSPFMPDIRFFSQHDLPALCKESYEAVINLGGSTILAEYAARMKATMKLGPIQENHGLRIAGFWHLYRESLTCNNRHNSFHWADLFRLDVAGAPLSSLTEIARPARRTGRVGLFIGASSAFKRPDALFWSRLASKLAHDGYQPLLLGGPHEQELGREVLARNPRIVDFCGKTTLAQLGAILQNLDLLITPDTGPMHLATFLKVPVLDLSMGDVQPAETGPYAKGQHVLTANISCVGCWECHQPQRLCQTAFEPYPIGRLVDALIKQKDPLPDIPGLTLRRTSQDNSGLFCLTAAAQDASAILDRFWKAAFQSFSGQWQEPGLLAAAHALRQNHEKVAQSLLKSTRKLALELTAKRGPATNFWLKFPFHTRMFAGNLEMTLQNDNFSPESIKTARGRLEMVQTALEQAR